jgi:hypothetical protein
MNHNADYFIKKFKAIPANQWCTHTFTSPTGKHCALGHLGFSFQDGRSILSVETKRGIALRVLFEKYCGNLSIVDANDGTVEAKRLFPNKTIKGRVLAALEVIKLMQEAGLPPYGR